MGGGGLDLSAAGGSTGDQLNDWGDNTGSNMVMVSGGKITRSIMVGVIGLAAVVGVTAFLIHKAS